MLEQSVKWLSFCIANSLTRTVVHFFPSAGGVSAPYQASCTIGLFGKGFAARSVVIEGARLSHPDGVRLDDIFPDLADGSHSLLGLYVEMTTMQPRVDLSASSCIIEFRSRTSSVRFRARQVDQNNTPITSNNSFLALEDSQCTTSLILVNASEKARDVGFEALANPANEEDRQPAEAAEIESRYPDQSDQVEATVRPGTVKGEIPPFSVSELPVEQQHYGASSVYQSNYADALAAAVYLEEVAPQTVRYVMFRDVKTKRPISVCSL